MHLTDLGQCCNEVDPQNCREGCIQFLIIEAERRETWGKSEVEKRYGGQKKLNGYLKK